MLNDQNQTMHYIYAIFASEVNMDYYFPINFKCYEYRLKYAIETAKKYHTHIHIGKVEEFVDCKGNDVATDGKYIYDYLNIIIEKIDDIYLIFIHHTIFDIDHYCYLAAISNNLKTAKLIAKQIDVYLCTYRGRYTDRYLRLDKPIIIDSRHNLQLDRERVDYLDGVIIQRMPIIERIDQYQLDKTHLDTPGPY